MDFAEAHPNIYAWLNLHTFGGVVIRPLGNATDQHMDASDLAVYRQVAAWAQEFMGYRTVSAFEEFCYEPDQPLRGDLESYAYHQRGALAYTVELWDVFAKIGAPQRRPLVDMYSHLDRHHFAALAAFDRTENKGRIFQPWRAFHHPQLGAVEIGGNDNRVGLSNPPYELIDEHCRAQSAAFLRVASLLPCITASVVGTNSLGVGVTQVTVKVANHGYLPTYGVKAAAPLPHNEPLSAIWTLPSGCTLVAPTGDVHPVGHLAGWGQGLYGGSRLFFPWTRGNDDEHLATFVLTGTGEAKLRLGSARVGYYHLTVPLP